MSRVIDCPSCGDVVSQGTGPGTGSGGSRPGHRKRGTARGPRVDLEAPMAKKSQSMAKGRLWAWARAGGGSPAPGPT